MKRTAQQMFKFGTSACFVAGVLLLAPGCGKITRIDFYNPEPSTYELQLLGDSYLDYENPKLSYQAYIPTFLNQYASDFYNTDVVYKDRSTSGAKLDHILVTQYNAARAADLADDSYEIKTFIINGGANDLREPCGTATTVDEAGNFMEVEACESAIEAAYADVIAFFDKLNSAGEIAKYGQPPSIVWLGRHNLPASVVHKDVINRVDNKLIQICGSYPRCVYADTRSAWTAAQAGQYLQSDDIWATTGPIHVTEEGGRKIATILWDVLTDPINGNYY